MNRKDSNLISCKNPRAGHLKKWIARGYCPKFLKFLLFFTYLWKKSPKFYKKLSSKPVVLRRVLLGESTVASKIKRQGHQ